MVNKNFNKIVFVSIISVLFMVGVGIAYIQSIPNPGIGGNAVLVSVDSFKMSLQEAIDYDFFVEGVSATQSYTSTIPNPGHSADEIFVSVKGSEMSLQEAINSVGLCGGSSYSYGSNIELGHSADEVWVSIDSSEMSLQEAINSGKLASVDGGWSGYGSWYDSSGWGSCSGCSQSKSQRRDRTCTNPAPACGGSDCSGSSYQTQTVSQACGKVNGGWSGWSGWSSCSVSCGGGTQTRTRTCNNPTPVCGGVSCAGSSTESQSCNTHSCCDGYMWDGTCFTNGMSIKVGCVAGHNHYGWGYARIYNGQLQTRARLEHGGGQTIIETDWQVGTYAHGRFEHHYHVTTITTKSGITFTNWDFNGECVRTGSW